MQFAKRVADNSANFLCVFNSEYMEIMYLLMALHVDLLIYGLGKGVRCSCVF